MFSVIIPLYNKAPYIERAIKSVQQQTFQEFEIIVIDDGSADESLACLHKVCDEICVYEPSFSKKITIIEQANQGVSTTRNNGAKLAKYDYLAFLDADDWWDISFLEKMKELTEKYPDAGIYGSNYYKVKTGKNTPAKIGVDANFVSGYIDYFKAYSTSHWMPLWTGAVVVPLDIFNKVGGFKTQLFLGEDFDL